MRETECRCPTCRLDPELISELTWTCYLLSTSKKQCQTSFFGRLDIQKPKNKDVLPRERLTESEVERLAAGVVKTIDTSGILPLGIFANSHEDHA